MTGKRCLVTGGSSGIGEAICVALAEAGGRVLATYSRHADAAESIAGRIRALGKEAWTIRADVSDANTVAEVFDQMDRQWGGIDLLVNSAGIDGDRAPTWEVQLEAWSRVIDVNLFGAFYCAREALRRMIPQKSGVIINITSVHEVIDWSGYSAYTAAKAGLGMLTRTLAQEAAPHGVRVLGIAPGAIKTSINKHVWSDPQGLRDLLEKIPLNRVGEPQDVAGLVVVVASDVASYVTGCTLFVDGGMTDYPNFAHGG